MVFIRPSTILAISLALFSVGGFSDSKAVKVNLQTRQQQQPGTPLFLDEPSCGYYQCDITWYPGDNVTAHWLDAPEGNVILDLMADAGATFAHNVATVPGTTNNCNAEGQKTCGQFSWIVASDWLNGTTYGNYSLRASSQNTPSVQSYTDIILVKPKNGTQTNVPFKALDPVAAGTSNSTSSSSSSAPSSESTAPTGGASSTAQSGQNRNSTSANSPSGTNSASSFSNSGLQVAIALTSASLFAGLALVL